MQAANLAGFRASEDPRFEAGIPDFINGILNFSIHFNGVHRKVDWRNPKKKSLNSMPGMPCKSRRIRWTLLCSLPYRSLLKGHKIFPKVSFPPWLHPVKIWR